MGENVNKHEDDVGDNVQATAPHEAAMAFVSPTLKICLSFPILTSERVGRALARLYHAQSARLVLSPLL